MADDDKSLRELVDYLEKGAPNTVYFEVIREDGGDGPLVCVVTLDNRGVIDLHTQDDENGGYFSVALGKKIRDALDRVIARHEGEHVEKPKDSKK